MNAQEFLENNLRPGVAFYSGLPGWNVPTDDRAVLMMLAISGAESGWTDRVQSGGGPAHSFYQMERMGGVNGVLTHPASRELAAEVCRMTYIAPTSEAAWTAMATERGDNLATAFARLLLWTDPSSLPATGDVAGAWSLYSRLWRPGRPDRSRFTARYGEAINAMKTDDGQTST